MANPACDLGLIATLHAGVDWDHEFTLYLPEAPDDAAAQSAVLAAADVVRFRLWTVDATAAPLSFTDAAASSNGSTVTIETRGVASTTPARVTVDLVGADTDIAAGKWNWLLDVKDASDSNRWQPACHGQLKILGVGTV